MIKELFLGLLILVAVPMAKEASDNSQKGEHKQKKLPTPGTSGYPATLIEFITPTTLGHKGYEINTRITPPGGGATGAGVIFDFKLGLGNRFMVGLGYGGDGIIGRGAIDWYPWPVFQAKVRLMNESYARPAIVVGFSTYGSGGRATDYNGFVYKSKGLFVAMSKGFFITKLAKFDLHFDVNYSLEDVWVVKWPNATVALDFRFARPFTAILEYDFALNQLDIYEDGESYAKPHHGFLHVGFRWEVASAFILQVNFQDLLHQRTAGGDIMTPQSWGREVRIAYHGKF